MKFDDLHDLHLLSEFATGFGALLHDVFTRVSLLVLILMLTLTHTVIVFGIFVSDSFWYAHLEPC